MLTQSQIDSLTDEFLERLRKRLEAGAVEYQNRSFDKPAPVLREEILEELEDYAVWSFILWTRVITGLESLEPRCDHSEAI